MKLARLLAYPVMALASLGVLASFCLAFAALNGSPSMAKAFSFLFPGVFAVWLPTILFANLLIADFKQRDFWKAALRGCPPWMRAGLWVVTGLAFAAFFAPFLWGSRPERSPAGFLFVFAVFYSVAFCVAYSVIHVETFDAGRRCLNGHRISPLAKFCEECGAPAAEGTQS